MNASQETLLITEGAHIYARHMNNPAIPVTDLDRKAAQDWEDWSVRFPRYARAAVNLQQFAFDQCLNKDQGLFD